MRNSLPMQIRILLALLIPALLVPLFPHVLYPMFVMKVLCYGLFALAFNLLIGFTGLVSFGHAAFFGWAGYVTGILMIRLSPSGFPVELAIVAGVAVAVLEGWIIGALAIRRTGIYFAMITLALSQVAYFLAVQIPWTGGEDGLQGIPRGHLLGSIDLASDTAMYYFALAVFVFGFLATYRIINSPFGQALKALRDNEPRATSLGYDTDRCKLYAFMLSAGLAGLAGALKALALQLNSLNDVTLDTSTLVLLMTLVGGLGTGWGPVVGATIVVSIQDHLASLGGLVTVITGFTFVICVSFFRKGIVGEWQAWLARRQSTLRKSANG